MIVDNNQSLPVVRVVDIVTEENAQRWLIDQLFSDPFASEIVPFDVWSFANVPPVIKF